MSETKQISNHAAAAKMIKAFCKSKGVKATVRSESYSMGSSVRVGVQDLTPDLYKEIKEYASQFQYGHFNGMEDIYEYSNSRDDLPQVKFVFVENRPSEEMRAKVWHYCKSNYAGMEGAPESHTEAGRFYNKAYDHHADSLIWQTFNGSEGDFWKQQVAA